MGFYALADRNSFHATWATKGTVTSNGVYGTEVLTERLSFLLKAQDLGSLGRAPTSGVESLRLGHGMGIVHQRVGETVTTVNMG